MNRLLTLMSLGQPLENKSSLKPANLLMNPPPERWEFGVILFSIQFSFAISGSGGFVAMMGLLLMQVGLSLDAIGAIMTANIFVTNFAAPVQWIMRDCDLLDFSYKVKVSANR